MQAWIIDISFYYCAGKKNSIKILGPFFFFFFLGFFAGKFKTLVIYSTCFFGPYFTQKNCIFSTSEKGKKHEHSVANSCPPKTGSLFLSFFGMFWFMCCGMALPIIVRSVTSVPSSSFVHRFVIHSLSKPMPSVPSSCLHFIRNAFSFLFPPLSNIRRNC